MAGSLSAVNVSRWPFHWCEWPSIQRYVCCEVAWLAV